MHSLVYQDNSDHFCHFSGQLNISGQIQDINEISGISGISGQVGPLRSAVKVGAPKERGAGVIKKTPYATILGTFVVH